MPKTILIAKSRLVTRLSAALLLAGLLTISTNLGASTAWAVGSSCNSIADCTNQINSSTNQVKSLKNEAVSYSDAINRLGSQVGQIQGQISYSRSEQGRLSNEITNTQAVIERQKSVLGDTLRALYIDGQMSTIEALATSNKFSDYVDKEEYRTAVQTSIESTLSRLAKLQAQLQTKKQQVGSLLSQQQSQASQLQSAKSEQSSLLTMNKTQQAAYNAQTAANQSKLAALIAAQRNANNASKGGYYFLRFSGGVGGFSPGAYPYKNAGFSMSTAPGCNDNDGPDKWGYCTRQCVSYAAWAVEASGRKAPRYYGNAKNWVAKARANGVQVANVPQRGDVAISTAGTWGHAMYVESVSGNRIYVSQYNQQVNGEFSYQWRQWQ